MRLNGARDNRFPFRPLSRRPLIGYIAAFGLAISVSLGTVGCGLTGTPANAASSAASSSGAQLTPSSAAISFGSVAVGSSTSQLVTITAAGSSNVTISKSTASGTGFTASGPSNVTLTPGQSITISVSFQPQATGTATGSLLVSSNASNSSLQIGLSGNGVSGTGGHSVALSWQPSTSSVTGYFVFRGSSAGTLAQLNSTAVTSTSYVDSTVVNGNTYVYAVKSIDSSNVLSNFSNSVTVSVP